MTLAGLSDVAPKVGRPASAVDHAVKRIAFRYVRAALLRYVRAHRAARRRARGRPPRLIIVLWTAWSMGGTIRAAFNLAEYMQERG